MPKAVKSFVEYMVWVGVIFYACKPSKPHPPIFVVVVTPPVTEVTGNPGG